MKPGPKNFIKDVSGIKVGHAHDTKLMSGTTIILVASLSGTQNTSILLNLKHI